MLFSQVAVVANNRSMNELPKVQGLLSYRTDDRKLYLKEKTQWKALATQKDVSDIQCVLQHFKYELFVKRVSICITSLNELIKVGRDYS